jgi:twitching motility protein PilT
MDIADILALAKDKNASDIHISPGNALTLRIDGDLIPQSDIILMPRQINEILRPVMSDEQAQELVEVGELDFAFSVEGYSRIRANIFRQRGTYAAALRILSYDVPTPQSLGIPRAVVGLTTRKRGLVLVTGATGSGKSTTLASLIEIIANRDRKNIITLEDPIEYLHTNKKSIVCQREIGSDTGNYAAGLRAALRQDPDVILVGEMRDLETISTAITAAETGHLVFSTLHTNSAPDAIDRMIDVFPPHQQQQIRIQLAGVIEAVIAQQLLPRSDTSGRVAAFEVLLANAAVRNLIREGKSFQLPSIIQTSKKEGMQTMDDAIIDIYYRNQISSQTAITYAHDPDAMHTKLQYS